MHEKVSALSETGKRVGLKINHQKTKLLKINTQQNNNLNIDNINIEQTNSFVYLGSIVNELGGTDEDIKRRVGLARHAFAQLKAVWRSGSVSAKTKLRLFNSNVKSVLLYGSETWRVTETATAKVQTFINRCLRQIMHIQWFDKIENHQLWLMCNQKEIGCQILERKWRWIGHTLRRGNRNRARQALEWNPQGKRRRGRPKQTWRRSISDEAKGAGKTWNEIKRLAGDREGWRAWTETLCFTRNQKDR